MSNWGLRPVKTPDGLYIREVYYNNDGTICDIEMQIKHEYERNASTVRARLKPYYRYIDEMNLYNPEIVKYDPRVDNLTEWTPDGPMEKS
jgi:hypothetical protein